MTQDKAEQILAEIKAHYKAIRPKLQFNDPQAVADYCYTLIGTEKSENFICLFLNSQNKLIDIYTTVGIEDRCVVFPKILFRKALELGAVNLILAHNHPSGSDVFSADDAKLTKTIQQAGTALSINILDHIILTADGGYNSAKEKNII